MVILSVVYGRKRFPSSMPLAGSCSASISALCHLPEGESAHGAAFQNVQWGVTGVEVDFPGGKAVGHCSFSASEVGVPESDALYAGEESTMVHR
jgi:hypothetical protein